MQHFLSCFCANCLLVTVYTIVCWESLGRKIGMSILLPHIYCLPYSNTHCTKSPKMAKIINLSKMAKNTIVMLQENSVKVEKKFSSINFVYSEMRQSGEKTKQGAVVLSKYGCNYYGERVCIVHHWQTYAQRDKLFCHHQEWEEEVLANLALMLLFGTLPHLYFRTSETSLTTFISELRQVKVTRISAEIRRLVALRQTNQAWNFYKFSNSLQPMVFYQNGFYT